MQSAPGLCGRLRGRHAGLNISQVFLHLMYNWHNASAKYMCNLFWVQPQNMANRLPSPALWVPDSFSSNIKRHVFLLSHSGPSPESLYRFWQPQDSVERPILLSFQLISIVLPRPHIDECRCATLEAYLYVVSTLLYLLSNICFKMSKERSVYKQPEF